MHGPIVICLMDKASMNSLGLEFSTLGGMVMICTTAAVSAMNWENKVHRPLIDIPPKNMWAPLCERASCT